MPQVRVRGFLPSISGLHFVNYYPHEPELTVTLPLGLVLPGRDPKDLCKNHQVLAYGYDLDGTDLTIWLYDPNYPDRDEVHLRLSIASVQLPVSLSYFPSEAVFCFFHTRYTPSQPPA